MTGRGWLYVYLAPAVAVLVLGLLAYRYSTLTSDDAFITYRYAQNLVQGEGPVWNPGERVEGYTNFLWMVILAGCMAVGLDPVVASKLLGFACVVLTLLEVRLLLRHYPWTYPRSLPLALGILVAGPWLPYWSIQGMETPLYAWLLTLSVRLFLDAQAGPGVGGRTSSAALALVALSLTRPEGLMVSGILGVVGLITTKREQRLRFLLLFAAPFLALYVPYFLWRLSYYGYLLPNTFYAKTGMSSALVSRGAGYVWSFLRMVGPGLLLFLFKPAFGSGLRRADGAILALLVPYTTYVMVVGGDYMSYHRFLTPLLPIFTVVVADGMLGAWRWARTAVRLPAWVGLVAYLLLLASPALHTVRELSKEDVYDGAFGADEPDSRFGLFLKRTAPEGASLATTTIGKIGYYSELRVHDMLGLTEPAVAHQELERVGAMAGHDKMDLGYVLGKDPTFFYFRPIMARNDPSVGEPLAQPRVESVDRPKRFLNPALKPFEKEFNERYRAVHVDFGDLALDLYVRRGVAWPKAEDS